MRSGEHPDQLSIDMQRNRNFAASIIPARDVVRIDTYIRRVSHLPGGRNVTHEPFLADLQPVSFHVNGATLHSGQYHFAVFRLMQVHADVDASERTRNVVDDLVDQLIQVENRIDLLRRLLQFEKLMHTIRRERCQQIVAGLEGRCASGFHRLNL